MLDTLSFCLNALLGAGVCVYGATYYVHMLQLESYQLDGYLRWLKPRVLAKGLKPLFVAIPAAAGWVLMRYFPLVPWAQCVVAVIFLAAFTMMARAFLAFAYRIPTKKPLVYTPRVKRLMCALMVVHAVLAPFIGPCAFALIALTVPLAAFMVQPIEENIKRGYLNQAKGILESRPDLIKIGITGSYGKTSVKFILSAILSEKYRVLTPQASTNTPMGITRVVREELKPSHQVFLAEMGARHVGDIKELCDLVHPTYGVLTSIGPQHLETFHNIETVANTKNELIEALPNDGVGFFAKDGAWVDRSYAQAQCEKYQAGVYMRAEEITVGATGSDFTLSCENERVKCHTRLLGEHNIQNLLLCACVARRLGLTMEQIARGISWAKAVEHRLELVPSQSGMTIIDDAFNASPMGTKAALKVLSAFAPARRIIVTPGLVELGGQGETYNREFGRDIASSADVAILVGLNRAKPIREGLIEAGFPEKSIRVVPHLAAATELLREIGAGGDVVLFENDLPDNYSE